MNNGCDKGICVSERWGGDRDKKCIDVWTERDTNQRNRVVWYFQPEESNESQKDYNILISLFILCK